MIPMLFGHYLQRVSNNVSLASEIGVQLHNYVSVLKLGCEFDLPRTGSTIRTTVAQSGAISTSFSTPISSTSTFAFTADLDYSRNDFNFG